MNARPGVAAAVAAFTASVGFALADVWLVAAVLQLVPAYVAGRWDRRRDRDDAVAAEVRGLLAYLTALEDARDNAWAAAHEGRWADDARLRPDWSELDRKPRTASSDATSPVRPSTTTAA